MFRKILLISEKVVLVLFTLAYLLELIFNIGVARTDVLEPYLMIIIVVLLVIYAIIAPLVRLYYVILFFISMIALRLVAGLFTSLIFYSFFDMNWSLIMILYIVVFFKSLINIKQNSFLKWLQSIASIVIIFYFAFFLISVIFTNMKAANYGYTFFYALFIMTSIAMIFSLPNSNFPDWKIEHRQLFTRLILPVWILIFFISTVKVFIPMEELKPFMAPELNEKWGMTNYLFDHKPGITERFNFQN